MPRALIAVVSVLAVGIAICWWLTRPQTLDDAEIPAHVPDPVAGELVFWSGGCASCHATPVDGKRARADDRLNLGGGLELDSRYGVFRVPNISPHATDGIGDWSMGEFVNAMLRGVAPDGRHYYPSFPYPSYVRMAVEDVMDLRAFIATLPAVAGNAGEHELAFPWSVRRGIGLWKRRYLDARPVVELDTGDPKLARGQQLVEGAGHCGECHTPRDRYGGLLADRWLAGAPSMDNDGRVPNITPLGKDIGGWSVADIAYYLESGFTPEYDTVGGAMVAVQESLAKLPATDRQSIAAYLKAVPPVE